MMTYKYPQAVREIRLEEKYLIKTLRIGKKDESGTRRHLQEY